MMRELEIRQARPVAFGPGKGVMSAPIPQTSMSASGPVYGSGTTDAAAAVGGGDAAGYGSGGGAVPPPPPVDRKSSAFDQYGSAGSGA